MSREFQVYNGAAPQSAQVSGKQVPYFGGIPQNGAAVDQALGQLAGTAERFAELHDQGVKQRATQERNKLRAEMDTELADAANQAWGTDESLFRKDGSVNTDRCDAIVAKYRERNQSVSPGDFLLDRNGAQHWHDQELEHEDIGLRVMKFASRQSLENVRTAFEDNYENAVLRQDWDGAARLVVDARGSLLSDAQVEKRLQDLKRGEFEHRQDGLMQQVAAAAVNPQEFAQLYDDPEFRAKLSQENQARMDAMAARMSVDVPERKVSEVKGRDGNPRLVADTPEAPRGLPRELVRVWNEYLGDFKTVDAQEAARKPLMVYLRGIVQHADDPAELERAKAVCKVYGHGDDFARAVVKQLRSEIDGTARFNAREAMGQFADKGVFFRPENHRKLQDLRKERAGLAGKARNKKESERYSQVNEELKKWEDWEKSSFSTAQRSILARYDDWLMAHPEATYREQARMFYGFVDGYSKTDAAVVDVEARADADAGVYDAKVARRLAERRAAGEALQVDIKETEQVRADARVAAAAAQDAADAEAKAEADTAATRDVSAVRLDVRRGISRNWAGNSERSILYVPKGHAMAGQTVKLTTPDDVCSYAEVMEHEGCEAPVMSQYLRRNLGVLHNPYGSISFDGYVGALGVAAKSGGNERALGRLAAYHDTFMDAAARNGLDPKLLMAIAMHETGRGTSSAFRNKRNAMGVSDAAGPRSFASVEDSIYYMARQLKRNYIDKGLVSVEQIGGKYAPIGAENDPRGLNKNWVDGVNRYLNELK